MAPDRRRFAVAPMMDSWLLLYNCTGTIEARFAPRSVGSMVGAYGHSQPWIRDGLHPHPGQALLHGTDRFRDRPGLFLRTVRAQSLHRRQDARRRRPAKADDDLLARLDLESIRERRHAIDARAATMSDVR